MTNTGSTLYHPVRFNRKDFAGRMLERYADKNAKIWNDLGQEQRGLVREEFVDTIMNLEESLATDNPAFLVNHARWVYTRYAAESFPTEFPISFFKTFREIVSEQLPEDYRKNAGVFAGKAVTALKSHPAKAGASPDAVTPLSPTAQSFLNFILAGDVAKARTVIDKALAAGTPFREINASIFRPVLGETGRLWQQNKVTIAEEHFVTGVIRRVMQQLHDQIAGTGRIARKKKMVVAACVGEELHEIGIHMVADFFELDGWNVYTTGANTPAKSILAAVKDQKADVVTLSITMPIYLAELWYLVRSLRADEATAQVKIIVGGSPFAIIPNLWHQVGADAVAASAEGAVTVAGQLTA
ncbi:MAG: cobalamin-dependent protein [Methanoregula sp.]|nr:cobalamin-dependent protein [Methanoregula sp.]